MRSSRVHGLKYNDNDTNIYHVLCTKACKQVSNSNCTLTSIHKYSNISIFCCKISHMNGHFVKLIPCQTVHVKGSHKTHQHYIHTPLQACLQHSLSWVHVFANHWQCKENTLISFAIVVSHKQKFHGTAWFLLCLILVY